jgi:hypothetical protein
VLTERSATLRRGPYGVADGEAEGAASLFLVSFFVVSVEDFLVVSADFLVVDDFLVLDFLVVSVFAGGVVVVAVSVLLVLQEARSPAANMTVME